MRKISDNQSCLKMTTLHSNHPHLAPTGHHRSQNGQQRCCPSLSWAPSIYMLSPNPVDLSKCVYCAARTGDIMRTPSPAGGPMFKFLTIK